MPQAQIDIQLLKKLNDAMSNHDQMAIARIERAGKNLLREGGDQAGVGYTVLGACAALRGEAMQAKEQHEKALRLIPHEPEAWANYLVSLMVLWDTDAVRNLALKMGEKFRGNLQSGEAVMTTLMELGLLTTAAEFKEKFINSSTSLPVWDDRIASVLVEREVSEDQLAQAVRVAREALSEKCVPGHYSCRALIDEASGPGEIAYGFFVEAAPAEAAAIERHMFERLGEHALVAEEKGAVTFYVTLESPKMSKELIHASNAT